MLYISVCNINNKLQSKFILETLYRPPGHHTHFTKEFADFEFDIHIQNGKDA